ncbi:pectinesterase family protein [Acetatifactor muris]|uniref:Pectinesterase A n=1 Tax=Acetatifactor muris TaxID=879566 RepID=A0A2K4ZE31_9FIRM|nr:pectinesterase family protein [Acetatifactor muris]MCR2047103.1 pectinesterase family protein [Acetatifactor muris]SOY28710.1 Pectinesterase A precursor [Acetatifactor muris]
MKLTWNETCLHVDSRMTDPIPFTYRTLQEAVSAAPAGTREHPTCICIEPDVYHMNGTPCRQGLIIDKPWLSLIGLGTSPEDTVLTDNRGHMVNAFPADGSANSPAHTVLCNADGLHCENITIMNTCNLDLIYPADPRKNEKKYSETITQAYAIGGNNVTDWSFLNCRLLGMLDTLSIQAETVSFEDCTLVGTNDFLAGGERIFHSNCKIYIYGPAPMYIAGNAATVFTNCSFYVEIDKYQSQSLYLTKYGSELILDHCDFHGNIRQIEWAFQPEYWQRSYYRDITLNGCPVIPGQTRPENSIPLTQLSDWLLDKKAFLTTANAPIKIRVEGPEQLCYGQDAEYRVITVPPCLPSGIKALFQGIPVPINPDYRIRIPASQHPEGFMAELKVIYGDMEGVCHTFFKARPVPQPGLKAPLAIALAGNQAVLYASLDTLLPDISRVSWYVVDGDKEYLFLEGDASELRLITLPDAAWGKRLKAVFWPLVPHSEARNYETCAISVPQRPLPSIEYVSYSNFAFVRPVPVTPENAVSGLLCMTAYRPLYQGCETAHVAQWNSGDSEKAFLYGSGRDGARFCKGFITAQRGAALRYLPVTAPEELCMELVLAPEKYMADGFGSANGQFLEVALPFDYRTKTGYALRIERVPSCDTGCTFSLRHYENGVGSLLSEQISCRNYLTDCHIQAAYCAQTRTMTYSIWSTGRYKPDFSDCPITFSIPLSELGMGALEIHHTGTVPLGNRTVIESLNLTLQYR